MSSLIAVILLFAALFFVSYITRRRYGVLGLALAAGALLSANWASTLTPFLEKQGIVLIAPPLSSLVQIALILIPPFALLFSGPMYTKLLPRIIGSLLFAVLAMTFSTDILASILVLNGPTSTLFQTLHDNQSFIIVIGLVAALVDVLLTGKHKSRAESKK